MTFHNHRTLIPGCYRCELDKDEIRKTVANIRYVIARVHDGVYLPTPRPVTLPAMQPGDNVRVTLKDDGTFDVVPLRPSAAAREAWGAEMWVDAPEQENDR